MYEEISARMWLVAKKLFPFQHNHPYLSAMISNGTMHYDHDRDGTHTMIGGCEVKFRNFEHDTWIAIRYENDVLTGTDLFRNLPTTLSILVIGN